MAQARDELIAEQQLYDRMRQAYMKSAKTRVDAAESQISEAREKIAEMQKNWRQWVTARGGSFRDEVGVAVSACADDLSTLLASPSEGGT